MRHINHLAVADRVFSLRYSHTERILTKILCWSRSIAPERKTLIRNTALSLIEAGAAFLVTGHAHMGELAMDRYETLRRLSRPVAKLADALATVLAAAILGERAQAGRSFDFIKRCFAWMAKASGERTGDVVAYVRGACGMVAEPRAKALRVVRAA